LYVTRGILYNSKGNQEAALKDFNKTLENLNNKEGDYSKAKEINYTKEQIGALCYRGCINRSMENFGEALKDLNIVLQNEPDNILALCERSAIYRDLNKHDKAWEDLKIVLNDELNSSDQFILVN